MAKNRDFVTSYWRQNLILPNKFFFQKSYRKISNMIGLVIFYSHTIMLVKIAKNTFFGRFSLFRNIKLYQMAKFQFYRFLAMIHPPKTLIFFA